MVDRPADFSPAQFSHVSDAWSSLTADLWRPKDLFESTPVTATELKFMESKGTVHSTAEISTIKSQIEAAARPPQEAVLDALKQNRVVGFGDIHGPLGPQMSFLTDSMPALKHGGVTNLAVEIPKIYQSHIDQWTAADQDFLRARLKDHSSLIDVIDSAKKAGIKVSAVDEMYGENGEKLASRDQTMARNIEGILKDPQAKVLYFAGGEHLQNGFRTDSFGPSAVDTMRRHHVSVATFLPQVSSSEDPLMHVARQAKSAASISLTDVPSIAHLPTSAGTTYDKWDNVVLFPPHYKMDTAEAELRQHGNNASTQLEAAVKNNKVLLLGEMSTAESEQSVSPHRQLIASMMPQLKKDGLTDLAIDIPPSYQDSLDKFNQTGVLDGVIPSGYDRDDFRAVLKAAQASGIKVHAVGLQNEAISTMQQIIDGLTDASANLASAAPDKKVMLWCREEKIANFDDGTGQKVSVSGNLAKRGVSAQSFAALNQDFTDWSLGYVTAVTPEPLSFVPAQTGRLKELSNTMGMSISSFDNVIIYPSPAD